MRVNGITAVEIFMSNRPTDRAGASLALWVFLDTRFQMVRYFQSRLFASQPSGNGAGNQRCLQFQFTLPNNCNSPTDFLKRTNSSQITLNIPGELFLPKSGVGSWHRRVFAAAMAVPKASMHEDDRATPSKCEIGPPRQSPNVGPVTEAHAMQQFAKNKLRLRITPANARHHPRASRFVYDIGQAIAFFASGFVNVAERRTRISSARAEAAL
jgi:hypothetical protein